MCICQIARMYDVTEKSVKVLLWKNRDISLVEAKAQVLKLREENQLLELGDGIPSLGQLGLQFTPISPEEKPTEEALGDQETEGRKAG
jgi:hypothetical protein